MDDIALAMCQICGVPASCLALATELLGICALACGGRPPKELISRDIPTVFFISKSDDHNRVDYGIHLDVDCVPRGGAVFPYWHEFEPRENTHPLGLFEDRAYGVAEQLLVSRTPMGATYRVQLRQLDRPMTISTAKQPDGNCLAEVHTTIDGVADAGLHDAFVQLGGFLSVDYVEMHGQDPRTGARLVERIKP